MMCCHFLIIVSSKKQQQGIQVRIILENQYNPAEDKLPSNHGLTILKENNIAIIDDTEDGSKGSGLMHHKFVVIDNQKVIKKLINKILPKN